VSKRRGIVLALVLLLAGLLWAGWERFQTGWERFQNRLFVENRSGQPITMLKITVGGETSVFQEVLDGAKSSASFRIASDDHFAVNGLLADGTKVSGELGYVTNGMSGERAFFVIHPEGKIEFRQSNQVTPY